MNKKLNELKSRIGSRNHKAKIVGRGHGSGMGKTSTRGTKGQWARKSGGPRLGFEGGQTPLFRRLPKFGFNNYNFRTRYAVITLKKLSSIKETKIDKDLLLKNRLIKNKNILIKIIGNDPISVPYEIDVNKISKNALVLITDAGGKVNIIK